MSYKKNIRTLSNADTDTDTRIVALYNKLAHEDHCRSRVMY